jgi:hypothetical protein
MGELKRACWTTITLLGTETDTHNDTDTNREMGIDMDMDTDTEHRHAIGHRVSGKIQPV